MTIAASGRRWMSYSCMMCDTTNTVINAIMTQDTIFASLISAATSLKCSTNSSPCLLTHLPRFLTLQGCQGSPAGPSGLPVSPVFIASSAAASAAASALNFSPGGMVVVSPSACPSGGASGFSPPSSVAPSSGASASGSPPSGSCLREAAAAPDDIISAISTWFCLRCSSRSRCSFSSWVLRPATVGAEDASLPVEGFSMACFPMT
mmetsp:Transcript_47637/g.83857  ORF Transcript_47637/g.83857 Transcript_47637/m.83857 type:complete len:206 (+) Transcript_47637:1506-2123(+)